ncbi:cyclin-domain-containing protein [Neohortaea acidophila]|uniref:Cyclin-domain-containing protein n=1 Tax=Neohortaea acidophila TaxID=245834 RepID=A0A6A6PLQ6_9PEZI|nr:cyclin-domain-containing protein [Neohortaea acidophila]KAF2480631.1 cyclin-domain-containing protein [Neohortaea acidophila]
MVAGLLTKITTTNDQQHEHLHRQPPHLDGSTPLNLQTSSVLAFHGKNVPSITILSYLSRINKYCPTSYEVFLSLLVYFDRMTEKVNAGPMESLRQANRGAMEHNRSARSSSESLASDAMEGVTTSSPPPDTQTITPPPSGYMEKGVEDGRPGTPHSRSFGSESPPNPPEPMSIDPYNLSHFFVVDSFNIHRLVIAGVTCASKFFSDIFYTNSRYAKVGGLPLPELNHLELQFLLLNDFRLSVPVEEIEAYGTMLVEFYAREVVAQQKAAQAQAMQARSLSESSSDSTNTVRAVA